MQVLHRERSQNFVSMSDLILLITNYIFKVSQLRCKLERHSCIQFLRQSVAKLLPITLQIFSWSKFKTLHPISKVSVSNSAQKVAIHSDLPSFSSRKFCGLKCSLPHSFRLKNAESSYHSHHKPFVGEEDPSITPRIKSCPVTRAIHQVPGYSCFSLRYRAGVEKLIPRKQSSLNNIVGRTDGG